ncbi:CK1 family protein kinase [Trichomonas vaginalis G3]|uniref:non-specific serine/threonine protein kinase n=1 Tax=Trichomonas vaginalis (strain ATCC PRA-98 / G3) TaxID=412133 RepID=A2EB52_TRIV3|nr:peptidyl-serine phosphorylation [Trichomonas vaginalis G3]EAY10098.1 CK1 family protein kinase [Trichomonas vaginalis G3]KAI5531527.1 peptidyl-serine phosphorylation [Trichomonas vaginalis G3]|eukprot:XP_001322321.1 CK1 family protein kinase [Trichomonas vaginalis G3]
MKSSERPELSVGYRVNKYEITKHIGRGGYGDIYNVRDLNKNVYAMKTEYLSAKRKALLSEMYFLEKLQGSDFFPKLIEKGKTEKFYYCIMELLGPSLSKMRRCLPDSHYKTYSVLRLSSEMLKCIQEFHNCGFVHRDIKPSNFLIRANRDHPICLIDFGLSAFFINPKTGKHIDFDPNCGYVGTCRYASLNSHLGFSLSRRDDLMSWFYSVIELAEGHVPWPGSKDMELSEKLKTLMSAQDLCKSLPPEFIEIYKTIQSLQFDETPPYDHILIMIDNAIDRLCHQPRYFDWEKLRAKEIAKISEISLKMRPPTCPHRMSGFESMLLSEEEEDKKVECEYCEIV